MARKKSEEKRTGFSTLEEKVNLYAEIKERIRLLKRKEEDEEVFPLPEIREMYYLALQVLERIRDEREKAPKTVEDSKEEAFEEWLKEAEEE